MAEGPVESECVGCVVEYHDGAPQAGEWLPDPTCPVHGDPELLASIDREVAVRGRSAKEPLTAVNYLIRDQHAPVEGRVVNRDGAITVEQLVNGLVRYVKEHPEAAALPVAMEGHCCAELLTGAEPLVQNRSREVGRYLLLFLGGAP